MADTSNVVGGGPKKVLYTLATIGQMGVGKAAKALTAKNTCKACAYGMGGQHGGMTNELDEFPSVCNKSVQAQSTDIQPPIPEPIFEHTIAELSELSGREMERLGRLGTPLFRRAGSDRFEPLDWDSALDHAAHRLAETDPKRTFFYSSGRSSNEAGFLFQLLARAYGTNNVNNCSYYCHQATSEGLATTIGKGTATVELEDLTGADLIFVIGANPSSNHPRFIHMLKNCRERGGQVIVINPAKEPGLVKFSVPKSPLSMLKGGSDIASDYLQPRIGSDIAVFKGLAKAVLEQGTEDRAFIAAYGADFDAFRNDIDTLGWDVITETCGLSREEISRVAEAYGRSQHAVFAWGMGMTHHVHGTTNVEAIANLALIRGMIGKRFAGLLPLRGHSNVQGIGTIGVKPVLARDVLSRMEEVFGVSFPEEKGLDTMACLKRAEAGEVDAAVIMGGNLWSATPDTAFSSRAMGAIGFKLFLTTTLNQGHVHGLGDGEVLILPVTARDEEWEPTTQESMFNFVRLSDGGIDRISTVRPESWILGQIGKRVLPDSPIDFDAFSGHAKLRDAIAAIVPGMEELADIDVAKREFHIRNRVLHVPEFGTLDGKAHFVVTPIPKLEKGKLMLASVRSEGQFNSIIYEETDSYRGKAGRYSVFLSMADMAERGLTEGQRVCVHSSVGEMEGVATSFDLPPGSVLAYYPEANVLIGTEVDPRSKTPAFKSVPVSVVAAD
ncbi:MAG: FdhF/YdeP family oxidoreductase [Devosia sp.]|uniref:FdhF/YdeP family oxidoreductase n=1 Tax=Devosia sp. TaxID=1871048 RepID=UPI0033997486